MHSNPSAFTFVTRAGIRSSCQKAQERPGALHFEGVLRVERARCLIAPGVRIPAASVVSRDFQTADGCARARLTRNDLPERRSREWLNAYERGLGEHYSLHASDPD